eukprot:4355145-Alexandrium_andersonii.AAC.1
MRCPGRAQAVPRCVWSVPALYSGGPSGAPLVLLRCFWGCPNGSWGVRAVCPAWFVNGSRVVP